MQIETPLGGVATPTIIPTKARPVIASSIPPPVAARAVSAVSFSFPSTSIAAKRARIHSKEEQLVAHSLLGLTGPAAASPAPLPRKPLSSAPPAGPLNFSFNLVPMAR